MVGERFGTSIGTHALLTVGVLLLGALLAIGIVSGTPPGVGAGDTTTADRTAASTAVPSENVSEAEYVESVPEPGDEYYEMEDPDGNWISYINPRDEYRDPYLGDGSGKICVTLLNEAGEPIVGETVPNTSVTVPTGEELEWHPDADPMVVEYPLTDHYDRPLDADQFGTSDDLPQGDGYMDSHCIEMHGQPEDATIEYGEAEIEGDHADEIELVGYVQQANIPGWDSSVDPIAAAESYDAAGGEWTYRTDASHGQAVVVLQLDRELDDGETEAEDSETGAEDGDDTEERVDEPADDTDSVDADDDASSDGLPGFGVAVAIAALTIAAIFGIRR